MGARACSACWCSPLLVTLSHFVVVFSLQDVTTVPWEAICSHVLKCRIQNPCFYLGLFALKKCWFSLHSNTFYYFIVNTFVCICIVHVSNFPTSYSWVGKITDTKTKQKRPVGPVRKTVTKIATNPFVWPCLITENMDPQKMGEYYYTWSELSDWLNLHRNMQSLHICVNVLVRFMTVYL